MRAQEFVTEAKFGSAADVPADANKLPKSQRSAMKGMLTMPDISQTKQGGSPYTQWRFGIAMAGAPDYPRTQLVHLLVIPSSVRILMLKWILPTLLLNQLVPAVLTNSQTTAVLRPIGSIKLAL